MYRLSVVQCLAQGRPGSGFLYFYVDHHFSFLNCLGDCELWSCGHNACLVLSPNYATFNCKIILTTHKLCCSFKFDFILFCRGFLKGTMPSEIQLWFETLLVYRYVSVNEYMGQFSGIEVMQMTFQHAYRSVWQLFYLQHRYQWKTSRKMFLSGSLTLNQIWRLITKYYLAPKLRPSQHTCKGQPQQIICFLICSDFVTLCLNAIFAFHILNWYWNITSSFLTHVCTTKKKYSFKCEPIQRCHQPKKKSL